MTINVISQNTAEREQETKELFEAIKPRLDEGVALSTATMEHMHLNDRGFCNRRWYKDLMAYAVSQGYRKRR